AAEIILAAVEDTSAAAAHRENGRHSSLKLPERGKLCTTRPRKTVRKLLTTQPEKQRILPYRANRRGAGEE
ncbi:MAG: hypothetical protein K2M90_00535, partial [Treponemataceae bacterium]|nr:hypothetical protein [Treponemataceae bacterium]